MQDNQPEHEKSEIRNPKSETEEQPIEEMAEELRSPEEEQKPELESEDIAKTQPADDQQVQDDDQKEQKEEKRKEEKKPTVAPQKSKEEVIDNIKTNLNKRKIPVDTPDEEIAANLIEEDENEDILGQS